MSFQTGMKVILSIIMFVVISILIINVIPDETSEHLTNVFAKIIQDNDDEPNEYDDDDEENEVDAKQRLVDGSLLVKLPKDIQDLAGIKITLAENISVQSENKAFATIIDIQELLNSRSEYKNILAEREVINTTYRNISRQLEQLRILHSEAANISQRELQKVKSDWEEQRARLHATDTRLRNIRENMIQKWNSALTELALKEDSEIFDRLINREEFIILMTLKAEQELSSETAFVFVNRVDDRNQARKAYFISAAPFSDNTLQGETYFLRAHAEKFRIGMRLYVWLPNTGFSGDGVNIPEDAVVWYAGKAWAYVQVNDDTFSRRSLIEPIATADGWLVKDNFEIGDRLVISGAQTLLSEEFKWAIPDEDDD